MEASSRTARRKCRCAFHAADKHQPEGGPCAQAFADLLEEINPTPRQPSPAMVAFHQTQREAREALCAWRRVTSERDNIIQAALWARLPKTEIAVLLGISRSQLYHILEEVNQ